MHWRSAFYPLEWSIKRASWGKSTQRGDVSYRILVLKQQALGMLDADAVDHSLEVTSEISIYSPWKVGSIRAGNFTKCDYILFINKL